MLHASTGADAEPVRAEGSSKAEYKVDYVKIANHALECGRGHECGFIFKGVLVPDEYSDKAPARTSHPPVKEFYHAHLRIYRYTGASPDTLLIHQDSCARAPHGCIVAAFHHNKQISEELTQRLKETQKQLKSVWEFRLVLRGFFSHCVQ